VAEGEGRAEDKELNSEVGMRKSEDKGQKTEVRRQKTDERGQKQRAERGEHGVKKRSDCVIDK